MYFDIYFYLFERMWILCYDFVVSKNVFWYIMYECIKKVFFFVI